MGKFEPPSPTLLMYKPLWMTAESENWTTTQLWVFLGSYMTSMPCLRYGHKKRNYFDEKSGLSVLLNHFKRLVLVLVLVVSRQRAELITPVCPRDYDRSVDSRLLKMSRESASATAAGRLFQVGSVRWTIEYLRWSVRARFCLNLWLWVALVRLSAPSRPRSISFTWVLDFAFWCFLRKNKADQAGRWITL